MPRSDLSHYPPDRAGEKGKKKADGRPRQVRHEQRKGKGRKRPGRQGACAARVLYLQEKKGRKEGERGERNRRQTADLIRSTLRSASNPGFAKGAEKKKK